MYGCSNLFIATTTTKVGDFRINIRIGGIGILFQECSNGHLQRGEAVDAAWCGVSNGIGVRETLSASLP